VSLRLLELKDGNRIARLIVTTKGNASPEDCEISSIAAFFVQRLVRRDVTGEIKTLVENPKVNKDLEVIRGKVVWHSKDRDEVYRKAIELRPKHPAFLFTGKIPKDMVIIL